MKKMQGFNMVLAVCLVALIACLAYGQTAKVQSGQDKEVTVTKGKAWVTSLTVFPVTLLEEQQKDVGEVVALLLEKEGFRKLKIAETTFKPEAGATFDEIASSLGAHVIKNPIKTDYALYCEYLGSRKEGVKEVRGVIVDRTGKGVWKESQSSKDSAFQRAKPGNPMACCVFMSERLSPMMIMASAAEQATEGPMAQLWARKSGLPSQKEMDGIEPRLGRLKKAAGKAKVVVYPIRVGKKSDLGGAVHLAGLLNEKNLCTARVAAAPLWFEVKPNRNEQRVLWDMAKAFREHLKKKAPDADYALFGDYMVSPDNDHVGAVHFVICDKKGNWVIVDFQNNHHEDFNAIDPKSLKDCNRLTVRRLEEYLK